MRRGRWEGGSRADERHPESQPHQSVASALRERPGPAPGHEPQQRAEVELTMLLGGVDEDQDGWADEPSPGILRISAEWILTTLIVTHVCIITCVQSRSVSTFPSTRYTTLPYCFNSS